MTMNTEAERIALAKWAYTTRRLSKKRAVGLMTDPHLMSPGDLVLARVDAIGQHRRLELRTSRRAALYEGDEIVVAYGNRYAPDQFEGVIPDTFGPCRLVAAGGVAAKVLNRHSRMKPATRITPLGLLVDASGNRINLQGYRLSRAGDVVNRPLVLAVAGTSMNSGKTTACANLVKGMVRLKMPVGAAKLTGTGAGADYRVLVDAGADPVYDFIDAGYVSTYRVGVEALRDVIETLCGHLAASPVEMVILEVADGILQRETAKLFSMPEFVSRLDGVLFAANDALGAQAGAAWLTARQLPVIGSTGVLTSSPLAIREAEAATGLPVFPTMRLARSHVARMVFSCLQSRRDQKSAARPSPEVELLSSGA